MHSQLFEQSNLEVQGDHRFALQNSQMLRVALGPDVLAVKGTMVAYQGNIAFNHEGAGTVGRFLKKLVTNEDAPLMRVSGQGEVFFAQDAGHVYLIELTGDVLSINGHNLLAFDAGLKWDIQHVSGLGMMSGGMFNTVVSGTGTVALCAVGKPVVLDCSTQPTYVDVQAAVGWSANLEPKVVSSMNMRSLLRGGTGEAFQYAFHGAGFVVVQPSEGVPPTHQPGGSTSGGPGGFLGNLMND